MGGAAAGLLAGAAAGQQPAGAVRGADEPAAAVLGEHSAGNKLRIAEGGDLGVEMGPAEGAGGCCMHGSASTSSGTRSRGASGRDPDAG